MKIDRVELYHFAAPLPGVFRPSWIPGYPQRENRATLVRIGTDAGHEGWAAGAAFSRERSGLGELLGPYLIGADPSDLDTIEQRLREAGFLGWRNAWIEPAIWDILGKAAGMPVYQLFGGSPGRIRLYASTGEVKGPEERVAEVESLWSMGFRAVKLRVHDHDPARDIAQVAAVARAFQGRELTIGVDANQGWRVDAIAAAPLWTYDRALHFVHACADLGVAWIEEPLAMDNWRQLAALRRQAQTRGIAIAGGELHTGGPSELTAMIEAGCYDVYQPDCTFMGGIGGAVRIMHRCMAEGLRFTPHTWTNGLGFAANVQVFGASPQRDREFFEFPYAPPGWLPAARDAMLTSAFVPLPQSDELELPAAPGLGVDIDLDALDHYAQRFYTATKTRVAVQVVLDKGLRTALELGRTKKARERAAAGA